ncbi:MAG: hypothetical protein R2791_20710, partial [Saprospiraceae bacterium]
SGGRVVAGSNPVIPTFLKELRMCATPFLFSGIAGVQMNGKCPWRLIQPVTIFLLTVYVYSRFKSIYRLDFITSATRT